MKHQGSRGVAQISAIPDFGELPSRLADVLLAVLRGYVESGQPVGSRDALDLGELPFSSATVRGAMAELMELGLLEQPHTSAGRQPTDAAFRLWVDHLQREPLAEQRMPARLARELAGGDGSALQRAADVLTEVTGQLGFSLALDREQLRLANVRFVRVSSERVMALLVSDCGAVRTRLLDERESDQRRLDRVSADLSQLVAGLTLEDARARLQAEIEGDRQRRDALWRETLALGTRGLDVSDAAAAELYVGDRSRLLDQPEFADGEHLRDVLRALEEKQRMLTLLDKVISARGVCVAIGEELGDPGVARCAVVAEQLGPAPLRGLGVIGPVRMRYDRIIPVVRYVSGKLAPALG
ncbi:MAG TPA: heat-inducible transcriptional repressor HrcA [Myxococcota bacterium]|nr:heat-inducible transcriptional repressor HrcA [Myxococcota bacterium]